MLDFEYIDDDIKLTLNNICDEVDKNVNLESVNGLENEPNFDKDDKNVNLESENGLEKEPELDRDDNEDDEEVKNLDSCEKLV
jgi:hypothetical protein